MAKFYKIDLHTHSIISQDGGLTSEQYGRLFEKGMLDCLAITDHNETSFALEMAGMFGDKIIVGEEIATCEGELIGLFLKKTVPPHLTLKETIKHIREQGGLIYVPHPFETCRKGINESALNKIAEDLDIIEIFNARAKWRGKIPQALIFAKKHCKAQASSSDAHCFAGCATSYSLVSEIPSRGNLIKLLNNGALRKKYAPVFTYLCPGINKLKHKFIHYGE